MNSVADSFGWPFQDSGWFGKMVLQGLIAIIPIVGWIALTGWMMVTIDYYLAGRIIGGLGAILCCVGLLFTIPYSTAIYAGVVTWYERIIAGPAPAPPPSPAGP